MTWKARFLWAFLVFIVLTVLVTLTAILFDNIPHQDEFIITSLLLAVHSLAALLGAVMWARKPARRMVLIGVGLVLLGGVVWITAIWLDELNIIRWRGLEWMIRIASTGTIPGLAMMVRALVLWPANRNTAVKWLSISAWGCGAIGGVVFLSLIWMDGWWWDDDILTKLISSAFTVGAGCAVGVFVVARLTKGDLIEPDDTELGLRTPVRLDCPRCGRSVTLQANKHSRCEGCQLKLRVEFKESRCRCGYLLHGLTGDVCPECGTTFETEEPECACGYSLVGLTGETCPECGKPIKESLGWRGER